MNNVIIILSASVIIIIFLGIYLIRSNILKSKYLNEIASLDKEKNSLSSLSLNHDLNRLKNTKISNKFDKEIKKIEKEIKTFYTNDFDAFVDKLIDVEDKVFKGKYKGVNDNLSELKDELEILSERIKSISIQIKNYLAIEEENRKIFFNLRNRLKELTEIFDREKSNFGILDNKLSKTMGKFESEINTLEAQDIEKTKKIDKIKKIYENINDFEVTIHKVPYLLNYLESILLQRIEDIKNINDTLISKGFNLSNISFDKKYNEYTNKLENITRTKLINLKYDGIEDYYKECDQYLDSVYKKFELETSAREKVNTKVESIAPNVETLKKNLINLKSLFENTSNYEIDQIVQKDVKISIDNASAFIAKFKTDLKDYKESKKPFTILNTTFEDNIIKVTKVLNETMNSILKLSQIQKDEISAYNEIEQMKMTISKIKLWINSSNIPVLKDDYYFALNESKDSLKKLEEIIKKKPININNLRKQIEVTQYTIKKFSDLSSETVAQSIMLENAIIHCNKFIFTNVNFVEYVKEIENHFWNGEYSIGLRKAIEHLRTVHPNIDDSIFEDKGTR